MTPTIDSLKAAYETLKYPWNPKFNLIGIRCGTYGSNSFNDLVGWASDKDMAFYEATTDPGFAKHGNEVPEGTASMKAGYYPKMYVKGFLRGNAKHPCLFQVGPAWYYRKKGDKLFDSGTLFKGRIGTHIHSTGPDFTPSKVENYSEGCQVIRRWESHLKLLAACDASGFDVWDYCLLQEKDIEKAPIG